MSTDDPLRTDFLDAYDTLAGRVFGYLLLRSGHYQTAEDLASTTWTKAWSAWKKRREGNVSAWVFQIARRTLLDHFRRPPDIVWDEIPNIVAPDRLPNEQLLREVHRELDCITPEQREIILLRVWEGLSFDEIAQVVNATPAACKMRYRRGLDQLQPLFTALIITLAYATTNH